jgi:hypothetical protein
MAVPSTRKPPSAQGKARAAQPSYLRRQSAAIAKAKGMAEAA